MGNYFWVIIGAVVALLYLNWSSILGTQMEKPTYESPEAFVAEFREKFIPYCTPGMLKEANKAGIDINESQSELYCTCLVDQLEVNFTPEEILEMELTTEGDQQSIKELEEYLVDVAGEDIKRECIPYLR